MNSWLRLRFERAGVVNSTRTQIVCALVLILVFGFVQDVFEVLLLSVSVTIAGLALALEWLNIRARARGRQLQEEWPTVLESLESAAQSGMSLIDSMRDLAESSHLLVAKDFAYACDLCDRGVSLDSALAELKPRFGQGFCDSTIETLRLVNDSGGAGFASALRHQARTLRGATAVSQQVQAKQGWVIGTAKIAVAAPWIIVTLLSSRPENAAAYSSVTGSLLLLLGLLASLLAVRLIGRIGRIDEQRRVFA